MYKHVIKRVFDIFGSIIFIVIFFIPMVIIAIAIKIDDPGPVFFKQKRIGKKKKGKITYFNIWKFRSMKMSAPKDCPTYLFENADQYITRVGRFIRKTSLDELPQIYLVLIGKLSFIGPRPVVWEQELIEERERYGANDILPGITGLAQINGRDKLGCYKKAKYDGDYTAAINAGKFKGFIMDVKCFFWTIKVVFKMDGVVEGAKPPKQKKSKKSDGIEDTADKGKAKEDEVAIK